MKRKLILVALWAIYTQGIIAGVFTKSGRDSSFLHYYSPGSNPLVTDPVPFTQQAPIGNNTISGDASICQHSSPAPLTGSSPTGGSGSFTFQWQSSTISDKAGFADIVNATGVSYAPDALSQSHWFRRIVKSGDAADTSNAVKITVDPIPDVSIRYEQSPYCGSGTASVTLSGITGGTFSSSPGLSINASTGAVNLSGSTPGSYIVNYTFTSGACTSTVTGTIDVGDPTLVITNPLPVCGSPTADLTDTSITSGSTYGLLFHYFKDAAGTIPLENPDRVSVSDTYYIQGVSAGNCVTQIAPVTVVLNDQPVITASDTIVSCKGQAVTLTASSPGNQITWQNIGTGETIVVNPTGNTIYKAIAINGAGCTDTAIVHVQIQDFSVSLKANPSQMLVGSPATLTTSANFTYEVIGWQPELLFSNQTANTQSIIVSDTTSTYSVIARSTLGCTDTASIRTSVDNKDFFIPNAFTPNNDGKNDHFKVYGSSVIGAEIQIFNQWGMLIYETKDNQTGWDGTHKHVPQPVGMYVYVVKVRLSNEDTFIRKGTIRLIR